MMIFPLYNSSFLHQTTTVIQYSIPKYGCIILLFYIKPQLAGDVNKIEKVV